MLALSLECLLRISRKLLTTKAFNKRDRIGQIMHLSKVSLAWDVMDMPT